ncbi:MAG: DUF3107 domain-containing protein [Propionibacteriaceae bacterium]|nr:DUF3107 domain-containing protein [Propionibacteriaceae bacterium]
MSADHLKRTPVEIKIGIRNVAREVTLTVDLTIADVVKAYEQARKADTLFTLDDASGRHMLIPPRNHRIPGIRSRTCPASWVRSLNTLVPVST